MMGVGGAVLCMFEMNGIIMFILVLYNNMSCLIDDFGGFFDSYESKQCKKQGFLLKKCWSKGKGQKEYLMLLKGCLGNLQQSLLSIELGSVGVSMNFILNKIYNGLSFVLHVGILNYKNEINLVFRPIIFNQTFLRLTSLQRRIYGGKIVAIFNKIKPKIFNQYKLAIDTNTGLIKINAPLFYQINFPFQKLSQIIQFYIKNFINNMKDIYVLLITLIEMSNQNPKFYITNLIQKYFTNPKLHKIFNYIKLLNFSINTGQEEKNDYATYQKNTLKEQLSLFYLNQHFIHIKEQIKSYRLYTVEKEDVVDSHFKREKEEIGISQGEKMQIIKKIQPPQTTHTNEGGFVVNYIRLIKKIDPTNLTRISSGGYSDIYVTQIQYILAGSYMEIKHFSTNNIVSEKIVKKIVILKRQRNFQGKTCKKKVQHQKRVLTNLKNAFSSFIPYYYFLHTSPEEYPNDLLMEYIHFKTEILNLEEYFKKQKHTMSQHTKVFIVIQILQGLRLLKDYQVVHLDLKPSNIMVGRRLEIKLIDFGQSYHPSFGNHQPGNSMPYSAPETYRKTQLYDSKSDVFSIGTILYYLLVGKHPFFIHSQKQRARVYNNNNFAQRWYFVPEGFIDYGQCVLFPFIMLLIGKCLHNDPISRPQLQWINLILRQYLQYY